MRVAVVGLGAMGSAAACHLASGGAEVVGFDRYRPPPARRSASGSRRRGRASTRCRTSMGGAPRRG
ncbi:MAG: NAD(P)-binding domain-containing protein [Dehalococcoidia bacterium]